MNKLKYIILTFIIASLLLADESVQKPFTRLEPEPQHKKVTQLLAHILSRNHYKKMNLNDSLSSEIYDRYLKKLDYNRVHFLNSDIESFEKYRYQFDDFLLAGHLKPAYEIFNVYQERFSSRLAFADNRIDQPFDYTLDEYVTIKREDEPWLASEEELQDLWRKRIKYESLDLILAGKDSAGIQETLHKRNDNLKRRISQYQSEDVFQIMMNSFSESYDPHTTYFSPKSFDNFKIAMSQSFEGIGARLSTRNEHTMVVEIIPGGPADKSEALHANDKITAVGQGYNDEMVDVIGWRIDDVVQLIRGKKSTVVRLQLIRANSAEGAQRDTIALVRDKVNIEDQTAKSSIIDIEHEGRKFTFGVIDIPTFYSDYEGKRKGLKDYNSTTRDVKNLIQEMDHAKINGIIIDLRGNGGGFLSEAVDLTGLFIENGPVVQVKNTAGRVEVEWDDDSGVFYNGPLVVLVNRISASASEIFAAAIQDYNRGIIVGTQTFGKGTVQNAIDLNRFLNSSVKLGQIKMTIAKFYRINGGSTQHVGVIPDVSFPSRYTHMEIGESSQPNALLWDQIRPVEYNPYGNIDSYFPQLIARHQSRGSNDPDYQELLENIEKMRENRARTQISLNEEKRRQEREKNKAKKSENESETEEKEPNKDLMLTESGHILGDYIIMSKDHLTGKK